MPPSDCEAQDHCCRGAGIVVNRFSPQVCLIILTKFSSGEGHGRMPLAANLNALPESDISSDFLRGR